MEERRLPPPQPSKYHTVHLPSTTSYHETYVVQFPRDQIYRVPPPEHAQIVEEHARISADHSRTSRRRIFLLIAAIALLSVLLVVAAVSVLRGTIYHPSSPKFSVVGIDVKNLEQFSKLGRPLPVYTVGIRATNPNSRMGISYGGGKGASLSFKGQRIGGGKVPSLFEANGANVDFQVSISGKPPPGTVKSLTGLAPMRIELKAEVPVEISSWIRKEIWDLKIYCDFTVKNSLAGNTKPTIASQECKTVP